jgi:hypothetical protein
VSSFIPKCDFCTECKGETAQLVWLFGSVRTQMYKLPRCSGKTIRRRRTSKGYATCNVIATIGEEMGRKVVDQGTSTIHQLQGLELTSRPATALNIFFCRETFAVAVRHRRERYRHRLPSPKERAGRMLDGVVIGPPICPKLSGGTRWRGRNPTDSIVYITPPCLWRRRFCRITRTVGLTMGVDNDTRCVE